MENFILTLSLLLIGMMLKRIGVFPQNTSEVLNLFVIYVSLPAMVLLNVPLLHYSPELLSTATVPWIILLFSSGLVVFSAKIFNWDRETLGALLLVVPLGNTSFLGLPMVRAFFGESAVPYALIYDQLGSFLALAIYGSIVLAIFSKNAGKASVKSIFVKIITFPPFISLVIALALHFITLPQSYFNLLSPIAATLVPVVMVAVGFQLSLKLELNKIKPFFVGLSIKMIIAPAIVFLLFFVLGLNSMVYKVTVFEAAMPPMISAGALAIVANLSPRLTAAMVAYGILFSFVSLPVLYYILDYL